MRIALSFTAAAAALTIAVPAFAQLRDESVRDSVFALPPEERFAATDANDDGKVDKDEYKAILNEDAKPFISAIWERLDTDEDGFLTAEEMDPPARSRLGRAGRGA